jgi:hypothetical protein
MRSVSIAALAACALAGCSSSGSSPGIPSIPTSSATPWTIRYSPGMPDFPTPVGSGFTFNFPIGGSCPQPIPNPDSNEDGSPCHQVDYVTRTPIPINGSFTIDYTIAGSNPVFSYYTEPGNTAGDPLQLTLMIEHANDQALTNGTWRWDSNVRIPFAVGPYCTGSTGANFNLHCHATIPVNLSTWAAVAGSSPGTQAQFNDVLANLGAEGFVLGGGDSAGHGIYLTSGSATFTLNSFTSP